MKAWIAAFLLLAVVGAGRGDEPKLPADVQDVIFLADKRPVRLRLHILIDGQPYASVYQSAWDDYLKSLFKHLDRDGDGFLNEAEGQRLPPPSQQGATGRPTNLAFNFRVVDTNGDGKLDMSEVAAYYRDYGGAGLQVNIAPGLVQSSVLFGAELFNRLDTNKDGKLSKDELVAAANLMDLDRDGDELLSPQEILPRLFAMNAASGRVPRSMTRPGRNDSAFIFPGWGQSADVVTERLRKRYGDKSEYRAEQAPDAELRIRLGTTSANEKPFEMVGIHDKSIQIHPTEAGFVLYLSDCNTSIDFHINEGRPMPPARMRQNCLDQFRAADIAKNGHLTLREAQLRGFFPQQFELLDRDLDGKLTEKELLDFLDNVQVRQAKAVTSVVSVLVSDAGQDLFDLLDSNRDGRLGLWELRAAPRLLAHLGKESLARDEVPRSYHVALGLCQSSFDRSGGYGTFTPRGLPMLALDWSQPGLVWFYKMDRNRDGYVSLREFLGPVEVFRKLDLNGDGLISPEEALKAQETKSR
jgi:Ca2+-binding EF-hand superfamily protein